MEGIDINNLADNEESKLGHWEYSHFKGSDIVSFSYWKEESDEPDEEFNVSVKEFNDLIDFSKKLEKIE